jgi:hypothetical protein
VRALWNRGRLHHRLQISEPDFEGAAKLALPRIEREPVMSLKPSEDGAKAKRRWKKSRSVLKVAAQGKGAGGSEKREEKREEKRLGGGGSRGNPGGAAAAAGGGGREAKAANLAAFFSPLKGRGGPAALAKLLTPPGSPQVAKEEKGGKEPTGEPAGRKPKSAMDALKELKAKRAAPRGGGALNGKGPQKRITPDDVKTKSKRNRKPLTAKEKEKQMFARMGFVEKLVGGLEEKPSLTAEEIVKIIAYMDFNGSGEVDEQEFSNAVRNAKRGLIKDEDVTRLMSKVDNELRIKQIRLGDLFRQLDTSGDGSLSTAELEFGLNMLCDVSWEKECERRKMRREAAHDRWKDKEGVRDAAKRWLTEVESLPEEFVRERGFFCRDIQTPERFEK